MIVFQNPPAPSDYIYYYVAYILCTELAIQISYSTRCLGITNACYDLNAFKPRTLSFMHFHSSGHGEPDNPKHYESH